ncbi:hypothetical protein ABI59_04355 [Acidobacteria bacterium Mor1]|nr:hypothetical protein ABI59_04355 [Acidobacteria bacterium Mor1]
MKRPEDYRTGYLKMRSVLHDRATSLPAFPMVLDELRRMLDQRRFIGVLHFGIDGIEMVESLYGWQVLDQVLRRTAEVLRDQCASTLPEGSVLALDRVAGDEFLAFVPETFEQHEVDGGFLADLGDRILERLRSEVADSDFDDMAATLDFQRGYAVLSLSPYHRFERRVYTAVAESRSREQRVRERRERSNGEELRRIIDDSAVRMLFQPVVDLETEEIHGYEALARGPQDSMFEMPSTMFAWSGRVGVDAALDRLCREVALGEPAVASYDGKLFLNVLPESLDDPEWALDDGLISRNGIDRSRLVLEVSDRGTEDPARLVERMERLKELGFALALDDIGTGYAGLAAAEKVRPDYLKADASLVRGIESNAIKQEIFASLIQVAERLDAQVVAEGVESAAEADALRAMGAGLAQGYHFAGPGPMASFGGKKSRDH